MLNVDCEVVKDFPGYEGLYLISSHGRVWSLRRKKWMSSWIDSQGYKRVSICTCGTEKSFKIHRLVAEAFVTNPHGKPQVNHRNGLKSDNRASNLEWVTCRENLQHAQAHGLNRTYKTTYEDKRFIVASWRSKKFRQNQLADMFNISQPAVYHIIKEYIPIFYPTFD